MSYLYPYFPRGGGNSFLAGRYFGSESFVSSVSTSRKDTFLEANGPSELKLNSTVDRFFLGRTTCDIVRTEMEDVEGIVSGGGARRPGEQQRNSTMGSTSGMVAFPSCRCTRWKFWEGGISQKRDCRQSEA